MNKNIENPTKAANDIYQEILSMIDDVKTPEQYKRMVLLTNWLTKYLKLIKHEDTFIRENIPDLKRGHVVLMTAGRTLVTSVMSMANFYQKVATCKYKCYNICRGKSNGSKERARLRILFTLPLCKVPPQDYRRTGRNPAKGDVSVSGKNS